MTKLSKVSGSIKRQHDSKKSSQTMLKNIQHKSEKFQMY